MEHTLFTKEEMVFAKNVRSFINEAHFFAKTNPSDMTGRLSVTTEYPSFAKEEGPGVRIFKERTPKFRDILMFPTRNSERQHFDSERLKTCSERLEMCSERHALKSPEHLKKGRRTFDRHCFTLRSAMM
jgi:hypothetical protein